MVVGAVVACIMEESMAKEKSRAAPVSTNAFSYWGANTPDLRIDGPDLFAFCFGRDWVLGTFSSTCLPRCVLRRFRG